MQAGNKPAGGVAGSCLCVLKAILLTPPERLDGDKVSGKLGQRNIKGSLPWQQTIVSHGRKYIKKSLYRWRLEVHIELFERFFDRITIGGQRIKVFL